MREGIEKNITKKETILEKLVKIKENEEIKMDNDRLYNSAWRLIDPKKLTKENQDLYALFEDGNFAAAQGKIEAAKAEAEKIQNPEERMANINFVQWIDDEIVEALIKEQSDQGRLSENN